MAETADGPAAIDGEELARNVLRRGGAASPSEVQVLARVVLQQVMATRLSDGSNFSFRRELAALINRFSLENGSDTPDIILADFLSRCLAAFDTAVGRREEFYGRRLRPGGTGGSAPEGSPPDYGRPTVPAAAVHAGTRLVADDGFGCIEAGAVVEVKLDSHGHPFVGCVEGGHYLSGQHRMRDGVPVYVGFSLFRTPG
jgi:hypothetical protein